jgi:hypothetical protein
MVHFVGLDNHLPRLPLETGLDDEPALSEIGAKGGRAYCEDTWLGSLAKP